MSYFSCKKTMKSHFLTSGLCGIDIFLTFQYTLFHAVGVLRNTTAIVFLFAVNKLQKQLLWCRHWNTIWECSQHSSGRFATWNIVWLGWKVLSCQRSVVIKVLGLMESFIFLFVLKYFKTCIYNNCFEINLSVFVLDYCTLFHIWKF